MVPYTVEVVKSMAQILKSFHRLFLCRACKRVIAGCWCEGHTYVEEYIDSCAFCRLKK